MTASIISTVFLLVPAMMVAPRGIAQDAEMTKNIEKGARSAYKEMLKETDKDRDGKISKKEFFAIYKDPRVADRNYTVWDTNKDGYILEDEYVKAVIKHSVNKQKSGSSRSIFLQPEVKFHHASQHYFDLTRLMLYVKDNPQPYMVEPIPPSWGMT